MNDTVAKIKQLKDKHERAKEAFVKAQTQIETLVEKRQEIIDSMKKTYDIDSLDEAKEHLTKLQGEQAALLAKAEEILDEIDL